MLYRGKRKWSKWLWRITLQCQQGEKSHSVKRSIESAIGSGNDQSAGTGSAAAKMCGLGIWSDPTATGNTFDTSLKEGFRAVSGSRVSLASLTEDALRGLLQAVYTASGAKSNFKLFAGPAVMNKITDYTRATVSDNPSYQFTQDVSGKSLIRSVLSYVSDFGSIDIIPDLFLGRVDGSASSPDTAAGVVNTDRAYLIPDDDTVSLKFLEGISVMELPDNGGGKKSFLRGYVDPSCRQSTRSWFYRLIIHIRQLVVVCFMCSFEGAGLGVGRLPFHFNMSLNIIVRGGKKSGNSQEEIAYYLRKANEQAAIREKRTTPRGRSKSATPPNPSKGARATFV